MKNIVYQVENSLYINATNKCTCNCVFCVRSFKNEIYGDLWLEHEPTVDEVLDELKLYDLSKYDEVVFCGYGEPTYRLDVIEAVSNYVHEKKSKTRINTNGHGNMINNKDITPLIAKCIDTIGVSLNDVTPNDYQEICRPVYGARGFEHMIDFAAKCVQNGGNVVFSVVDIIGKEKIEMAKKIAQDVGAKLRIRELIEDK